MRPRVVLADDHRIVAEGLRSLLEPELELVATVEDGRALVAAFEEHRPDVLVVDISMPLLNGIEALRHLKAVDEGVVVIFLTMHQDVTYAARALAAGARGYVLKHSAPSELLTAIREALAGRVYVSPLIPQEALASQLERRRPAEAPQLTGRQREVLQLVAEGKSAKEVAAILGISPRTVEFHKYRLMRDLEMHSSAELVQYAIKHGIVAV